MARGGRLLVPCAALAAAASCALGPLDPPDAPAGRVGASIAVLASGEVAVVNPDEGSVSLLDPESLAPRATIDVGGEPRALLELASGALLVSTYRGGAVALVDPAARAVVLRRPVCAGAFGLAEAPDGAFVAVGCEWDGSVLRLDPATLEVTPLATGLRRPRAVAVTHDAVWAAELTGGRLVRIDVVDIWGSGSPDGAVRAIPLAPESAPYRPALARMTPSLATAIAPASGALHVAHQLVNHTGDASEPVADDYGSVEDRNPKINPAVTPILAAGARQAREIPAIYARFDGGARAFNGPSAIAAFGPRALLVAHVSTGDVAVLDAGAASPEARVLGSFRVGAGPAGVAVDAARAVAYVDNALDRSVSRIDLDRPFDAATAPRFEADLTRTRDLPSPYSAAARAGRKIFHDATSRHLTPAGVVACSTCHPDGGDDGLVWFIHTAEIPRKRRRTQHLAGAGASAAPFHWDGALATRGDLIRATVTGLMAGDGLLLDVAAVEAYLDEIVAPPRRPAPDADRVARGRAVFASAEAGCAACHEGPDLTDNRTHAVLQPMSLAPDDAIQAADTPGLHGVFLRAPYFHDGRAADLRDVLERPDAAEHGGAAQLSPDDREALLAYLESL